MQSAIGGLGLALRPVCAICKQTDFTALSPGAYAIEGSEAYAIVQHYETGPLAARRWEAHRRYIDIQFVLDGVELMGYANLDRLAAGPYDEDKDYLLLEGDGDFFVVRAGTFVIFMPQDAHMPGRVAGVPQAMWKVVVKVPV